MVTLVLALHGRSEMLVRFDVDACGRAGRPLAQTLICDVVGRGRARPRCAGAAWPLWRRAPAPPSRARRTGRVPRGCGYVCFFFWCL